MSIFIDTSAFLAMLNAGDQFHAEAKKAWEKILSGDEILYTSSYILVETVALLQNRFGVEAVRLFESDVLPVMQVVWADENIHKQGMNALLTANRRDLSLVDCTSFGIVRQFALDKVFTFNQHFKELGFSVVP